MKCSALIRLGENVLGDFERLNGGKSSDTGLFKGAGQIWFVELPVSSVGSVNRLKWDQFSGVQG